MNWREQWFQFRDVSSCLLSHKKNKIQSSELLCQILLNILTIIGHPKLTLCLKMLNLDIDQRLNKYLEGYPLKFKEATKLELLEEQAQARVH